MQADRAYVAVRDMIVSLELRPGTVIDERALMSRLGIGRTPLREAVRRLAHERLVEVFPRRGTFVTSVDIRDLASLAEVRLVLEPSAAALAAERDTHHLIALDERIHRQVYRCTHNAFLEATLEEYYVLALRIWYLALDQARELEQAVLGHRELLEAIRDGDAEEAASTMRQHVQDFEQAMRRIFVGA
jgi:DNA-binding GntR family transcriptional regulator